MAGPKDGESFLRKVVRFVANPATDWTDLNTRQQEPTDNELERTELKAMIERKRRNDFVRRREFDMLRRVRREGLTPEQLAALGGSSRIDDPALGPMYSDSVRPGVKAKIDAIEQQMVGESVAGSLPLRRKAAGADAPTQPAPLRGDAAPAVARPAPPSVQPVPSQQPVQPPAAPPPPRTLPPLDLGEADELPALPPLPDGDDGEPSSSGPASTPAFMASGLSPLTPTPAPRAPAAPGTPAGAAPAEVEVSDAVHDPELDEAVIAFANADFDQCEHALTKLIRGAGPRAQHADTWLVLFDLYRATGRQQPFETLAMEFVHQFGWSAPQWYSLPQLVAEAKHDEPGPRASRRAETSAGDVGWAAPEQLDTEALARLRSQTLQMPLPWILDWSALRTVDAEAATQLSVLCRMWAGQALEMQWIGGDRLFSALQDAAPTGVRDADPAFWLARLDALRLTNRADQFDEVAIDYCVTYEVSPPAWEPARCTVRIGAGGGGGISTRPPPLSMFSEVSTTFFESRLQDEPSIEVASVELSGQLVGDIGETLRTLQAKLGDAPMVSVSCARLIRVDFLAAGDLLNWVLTLRGQERTVQFTDAHRLVTLFFSAMGINEHAQVQVRRV